MLSYYGVPGGIVRRVSEELELREGEHGEAFDVSPMPSMLERLARLTNHDAALLERRTLRHDRPRWPEEWFAGYEDPNPLGHGHPTFRTSQPAHCPLCIGEMRARPGGPYLRREWSLTWSTMCRRHHVPLIHGHPSDHGVQWFNFQFERGDPAYAYPQHGVGSRVGPDDFKVLGWQWLTQFEAALIDAMDGRGLAEEWGGPATPEQLQAALSDLVGQWGAGHRNNTVLPWVTPALFLPPKTLEEDVSGLTLPNYPVHARRWFVSALAAIFLGFDRWKCMHDMPDMIYSCMPEMWPGDHAFLAGLAGKGAKESQISRLSWPEEWSGRALRAWETQERAGGVRRSLAARIVRAGKRPRAKGTEVPLVSPPLHAHRSVPQRSTPEPNLPLINPKHDHLKIAKVLLTSDEGKAALRLRGAALHRALGSLARKAQDASRDLLDAPPR